MKKCIAILLVFTTSFSLFAQQNDLSDPYNQLEEVLPPNMHGWFNPENRRLLKHIIRCNHPKVIVELGTWVGLSAIHIAEWAGEGSALYTVDHFKGNPSSQQNPDLQDLVPVLYEQFLSNVIHHELTDRIIPVKMATDEAAEELQIIADLIYIDAGHEFDDVYNDIMTWFPKLKKGGIMCGDDYYGLGVQQAVHQASGELGINVHAEGNFWWYQ